MDRINLVPLDKSALFDQENHVSEDIWEGTNRGVLKIIQNTSSTYNKCVLTEAQILLLKRCGFKVFTEGGIVIKTGSSLVFSLV